MTGLKPNEMDEMMSLVLELKKQISIVVVEHVMRVVMRICDRIMAMEQGRKIAEGSPDEIANDKKVIEAYLGRGQGVAEN
jgi:branched-chain amino acid transport system ATP-binding protein